MVTKKVLQLSGPPWTTGEKTPDAPHHLLHVDAFKLPSLDALPPLPSPSSNRRSKERKVPRGNDVDRASHQRRLDGTPPFQGRGQSTARKAVQPRPQRNVCRRRVLRLKTRDALESAGQRAPIPLQQQLAGQKRSIERSGGEDRVGHSAPGDTPLKPLSALRLNVLEDFVECPHEVVRNLFDAVLSTVIGDELLTRLE